MATRRVSARASSDDHGQFFGTPETCWLIDHPDRRMRLLSEFSFVDPDKVPWKVPPKYVVDGASIPRALWTLIGSPYTGDYRRASIVHDKACDDAKGNNSARKAADRMFYHACRAGGCSPAYALLLYLGVRFGAWMPSVAAWRGLRQKEGVLFLSAADGRMQADFRLVGEKLLSAAPTDDPMEIQRRTDAAIKAELRVSFS